MSHPSHWATVAPDRTAIIMARSGERMSYAQLDAASNRGAHLFRQCGLRQGDGIVIVMDNHIRFFEICWAAQRAGLYFTPASWRLKADELSYILENSGATLILASPAYAEVAREAADRAGVMHRFSVGGAVDGFESWEEVTAGFPSTPVADEALGRDMLYSSGTTGRPKGVKQALMDGGLSTIPPVMKYLTDMYGFGEDTVNLTPAPLYHAGPLRYSMCVAHTGGTNIVMESFDAEELLSLIERHRVTHAELVPTMFVRLMKLPEDLRRRYDVSSLRMMIHGTGPCAPEVKRGIIEWFGPIVHEQYGGTEGNGLCMIGPEEWLAHPGSVGKAAVGTLHILGPDGKEVPPGETGLVYFGGGPRFEYHGDPEKTAGAYSPEGWSTLGDIGHVDAEGYLYLTDRQSHMIISGGVNIYPQEAENVLITHPSVADVAVFGIPDEEFGEAVMGAVIPAEGVETGPMLERELIDYCRSKIAALKSPRSLVFVDSLPRHETGKIYKRLLKDRYAKALSPAVRS